MPRSKRSKPSIGSTVAELEARYLPLNLPSRARPLLALAIRLGGIVDSGEHGAVGAAKELLATLKALEVELGDDSDGDPASQKKAKAKADLSASLLDT